jgi:hypothetical protein
MTDYPRGGVAELRCAFLDRPDGVPTDPSAITLTIKDDGGATIAGPWAYPGVIQRELIGLFGYDWSIPEALPLGEYTAVWSATINAVVRTGYELLTVTEGADVVPGQPGSWASSEDVARITGISVTSAVVEQAQAVIDIHAARTYDARDRTGSRDQRYLQLAVAYQAAWMKSQPDYFQRMDLTGVTGPGAATGIAGLAPTGMVLAPSARWALRRVSWLKSRSLHTRAAFTDAGATFANPLVDSEDDDGAWAPLGAGWGGR